MAASELISCCKQYPQVLINVTLGDENGAKERVLSSDTLWAAVKEKEAKLAGEGRILIRASGTEPLIRVMVEAKTDEIALSTATDLADMVKSL